MKLIYLKTKNIVHDASGNGAVGCLQKKLGYWVFEPKNDQIKFSRNDDKILQRILLKQS